MIPLRVCSGIFIHDKKVVKLKSKLSKKAVEFGNIQYAKNGKQVANTVGAFPIMTIEDFPKDVDHDWYISRCLSILNDIGNNGSGETQHKLFN